MSKEKPFFLKRWISQLFSWLDKVIFGVVPLEEGVENPIGIPMWMSLLAGTIAGLVVGGVSAFVKKPDTIMSIVASVGMAVALGLAIWYIIQTSHLFEGTWRKIGHGAFVLIGCLVLAGLGIIAGAWLFILVAVIFVGWIVLLVIGGGGGGSSETIRLDDGTILKKQRDMTGSVYYHGNDGYDYERDSNGNFSRMN